MNSIEAILKSHGIGNGVSISKYYKALSLAANGAAIADITDRTTGMQGAYYDLFDNTNNYSVGFMDTTKTKANQALTVGTTVLTDKVDTSDALNQWFKTGQEITIQDDVNKECVTVTSGGIVSTPTNYNLSTAPATVFNSGTSVSKDVRPQILDNGWLIQCAYANNYINIKVSKDGGVSWSDLCYFTAGLANQFSITSRGTRLFMISSVSTSTIKFISVDATTVPNILLDGNGYDVTLDTQSSIGDGCSVVINPLGTEIHACWSSKNATYPNSFNIRYIKGTIGTNGAVTWDNTVMQLPPINTTNKGYTYPTMLVVNNEPVIVCLYSDFTSPSYQIRYCYISSGSWNNNTTIAYDNSYQLYTPDALVDPNDVVHVTWNGKTSTGGNNTSIFYCNSLNWSIKVTLATASGTDSYLAPSITRDRGNNIYVVFSKYNTTTGYTIGQNMWNGSLWSGVTTLASISEVAVATALPTDYMDFSSPLTISTGGTVAKIFGDYTFTFKILHLEVTPLTKAYKKNAWIYRSLGQLGTVVTESNITTVRYDYSTPINVASNAYDTSGNGGRKIVRLSNGWIVAGEMNTSTIQFQVSKNNGATFSVLCYITGGASWASMAITSVDTTVHVTCNLGTGNLYQYYTKFDATTVVNTGLSLAQIDTAQTSMGAGCSIAADPNGKLWAVWSSRNSTYANNFNIRVNSSSDNGATWGTAAFITSYTGGGYDTQSPTVVINSLGNPTMLCYRTEDLGNTNIYSRTYNSTSSTWDTAKSVHYTVYSLSNPSAVVTSDGVIHAVWQEKYTGYNNSFNIVYAKSTDNGATWVTATLLTTVNQLTYDQVSPSITADTNNNLYVVFAAFGYGGTTVTYSNIWMTKFNGSTWSTPSALTNNTTGNASSPSTCENFRDFIEPMIIYQDSQAGAVKFRGIYSLTAGVETTANALKFSNGFEAVNIIGSSTPTTVVAAARYTNGTGKKLVRLSNGWLVCVVWNTSDSDFYFYKSTDDGSTWSQLCYISDNGTSTTADKISIISKGTTVYVLTILGSSGAVYFVKFDATTVLNQAISVTKTIDTGQTSWGSGIYLSMEPNGKLWAVWCSKNSSYDYNHNLRVSSSSDDGTNWASATQLTTDIIAGDDHINPCIVIKSDGYPCIIWQKTLYIYSKSWTGSAWDTTKTVCYVATKNQYKPCAVVDSIGTIHVVWSGLDATDTTAQNIKYSKSTDGGITWSAALKLTTGNSYNQFDPVISVDNNNNLYVIWYGADATSSAYNLRKIIYSSNTWGTMEKLTTSTSTNIQYPSICWDLKNFSDPPFIYQDNPAGAVKFRGVIQDAVYVPLIIEDIRYNIIPPLGSASELASWISYKRVPGISMTSIVSMVDASANESYKSTIVTTTEISTLSEKQYIFNNAENKAKITQKIILARMDGDMDAIVLGLRGAIG